MRFINEYDTRGSVGSDTLVSRVVENSVGYYSKGAEATKERLDTLVRIVGLMFANLSEEQQKTIAEQFGYEEKQ